MVIHTGELIIHTEELIIHTGELIIHTGEWRDPIQSHYLLIVRTG